MKTAYPCFQLACKLVSCAGIADLLCGHMVECSTIAVSKPAERRASETTLNLRNRKSPNIFLILGTIMMCYTGMHSAL